MRGTPVCRAQMGTPATFRAASSRPGNPTLRRVRTTSHSLQTNTSSSIWGKYSWRNWDSSSRAVRIRRRWVIRESLQTLINDMAPFKRMALEEAEWESGLSRTCSSTRRSRRSPRSSARVPIRLLTLKVCNNIFIKTRPCTIMSMWTPPNNSIVNRWRSCEHPMLLRLGISRTPIQRPSNRSRNLSSNLRCLRRLVRRLRAVINL